MYESISDSHTKHFITDFQVPRNPFKDSQVLLRLNGVHIRNPWFDAQSCWTSPLSPWTFFKIQPALNVPSQSPIIGSVLYLCISVQHKHLVPGSRHKWPKSGSESKGCKYWTQGGEADSALSMGAASFRSPKARFYVNSGFKCWQIF